MNGATTIQERLKDLRLNKGLKLEELAEQTGISKSALGSYEKDDYKEINHGNLILLADFYGVSLDYLFCRTENMAQLKAMYKNDWESLVGLCDEFLYLGGNEQGTHKYVSELIGKETISIASYNRSRGRNGSYSVNRQTSGRELLKPDEVRLLGDDKAILFVRGERPILDDKYDLLRHPNIRFTEDGGASPYDYTAAAGAANDLPGQPEQYELLDMDDFEDKPKVSAQQNLQTNLIYRNRR